MVLCDGYAIYLTLFVIFALIASANDWWTSFDYVFSGHWSKGVNLFSLWAALFTLAVTLFITVLIRAALRHVESRLGLQSRTITRLAGSLVKYAASFFLFFYILGMFGVNTTVLLASAGVVSIAVGMGAQSMASDLLAGFFMMLEGSVHVGDYVYAANVKGRVTDMGIRTTEITDEEGNVTIVNNSKINPIQNMTRSYAQKESEGKKDPTEEAKDVSKGGSGDDSDDDDD
jgi:small conductance mechanosensitive channel